MGELTDDIEPRTGGPVRFTGLIPLAGDGCVSPDISEWLASLPSGSITISGHFGGGDQDLPEHVGKPVTNEAGERIGTITKATQTADGELKIEATFDESYRGPLRDLGSAYSLGKDGGS